MSWVADAAVGGGSVRFRGEGGYVNAHVFKGGITPESWAAFRSLSVPVLRARLLPGWRVEAPEKYLAFDNPAENRRYVLFYAPRSGNPLVLKFDSPAPDSLLRTLRAAFQKGASDGQEVERGRPPEVDRQDGPLPDGSGEPEPGVDPEDGDASKLEGREPEGQQVAAAPWWKSQKKKAKAKGKARRGR